MNRNARNRYLCTALTMGICLSAAPAAWADAVATGTGQITNIQYGLTNPGDGTINWFYDDGFGNPAWQGEAWVQVSDSQGGADADYNTTPDGFGVVSASASTAPAWGTADVDLTAEELYGASAANIPVGGWSLVADYAMMFDYFSFTPSGGGGRASSNMGLSFDYEIHLTGQAVPGAGYYVDKGIGMTLEYEDEFGDWQLVPGGQLFTSEVISGSGTDSDDVLVSGSLATTVALDPEVMYSVQYYVYDNIPEPAALGLLLVGSLIAVQRRHRVP